MRLVLVLLTGVVLMGCLAQAAPPVFAVYYTWYGTPWGAKGNFGPWAFTPKPDQEGLRKLDPGYVTLPPSIRDLHSAGYPLIGPYDSMDKEVVRWHIRLAKAAGLDAFLVDWWGPAGWQTPSGWTRDVFINTVLPVAEEEGFKVALFDECPQFVDDFEAVVQWTSDALKQFKDSPAYLHIDGQPVWYVYQLWEGKLSPAQGAELIQRVEAEVGPVYWIFDRLLCRHSSTPGQMELYVPEGWPEVAGVDCFTGYALFSTWPIDTYEGLAPLYKGYAELVHHAGHKVMLPLHPGHDNSRQNPEPYRMPRRDGETFRGFWRAAEEADSDFLMVTSFNEWPETTIIEPSLTWGDPYQYLKLIAELKGGLFTAPPLPPMAHVDPLMVEYLERRYGPGLP